MLNDFLSFDKYIFPRIVRLVYFVGLFFVALGALAGVLGGLAMLFADFGAGLLAIVIALVGAALGALVWRLVVELWLVIFSINDNLKAIRDRGSM